MLPSPSIAAIAAAQSSSMSKAMLVFTGLFLSSL